MTLQLTTFEGDGSTNTCISALSDFRAQQLLPRLQAIDSKIIGISARFIHVVATDHPIAPEEKVQLAALLSYGEPCKPQVGKKPEEAVVIVSPRLGTVSPWASKATDIARNCGLAVKRIERITEYRVALKSGLFGKAGLTAEQHAQVAALLHDRMTESVMADRAQVAGLFTEDRKSVV